MPISSKKSLDKLSEEVIHCKRCLDLVKTRIKPVPGKGAPNAKVIIVKSHPSSAGAEKTGKPFTGDSSGELIRELIKESALSLDTDIYLTYLTKCTPRKIDPSGKAIELERPLAKHISNCISFLTEEISITTPHMILSLGINVSNVLLDNFFSISKKHRKIEKIHMKVFENPSFKLVPFFAPEDVYISNIVSEEKYKEDFNSLAKLLSVI